jgi:amino acid adenylation domain-containing protein
MHEPEATTLVELLRWRAARQPEGRAYTFLLDGEAEELQLSYGELDSQARAIAVRLAAVAAAGDRALLLYPPGLQYAAAFFGCLYAGITAVPVYPPRPHRVDERLLSILLDARPSVVLTTSDLLPRAERLLAASGTSGIECLASDGLDAELADAWRQPPLSPFSLAFLQYTSGSTAAPKGVMVTHGNLMHNERLIGEAYRVTAQSLVVGWLPLYHDMGLIGNLLQPLYAGCPCVLLSPLDFLQRPLRWLRAISRYRGSISGGPNFAFDLCVRKIAPADRESLDLSCWEVAFNGAEPVHAETLDRFVAAFAPCGFRREALLPCYGLAETTLFVAGGPARRGPVVARLAAADLERNLVRTLPPPAAASAAGSPAPAAASPGTGERTLVSCGEVGGGAAAPHLRQRVVVVEPESRRPAAADEVGEVWVSGPSVAAGYWNRPELSASTFCATLAAEPGGPCFLRTGDLGFLAGGELFIAGRAKDLIIIRGRNHYPQDVEATAERSHGALRAGCGIAFSIEAAGEERLVLVHELRREHLNGDPAPVIEAIRAAVAEQHEVQPFGVTLIRTATLPKTTSGKVQRRACRAAWLAGELAVVAAWTAAPAAVENVGARTAADAGAAPAADSGASPAADSGASPAVDSGASPAAASGAEPAAPSGLAPAAPALSTFPAAPAVAAPSAVPAVPAAPAAHAAAASLAVAAATAGTQASAGGEAGESGEPAAKDVRGKEAHGGAGKSEGGESEDAVCAWLAAEVASRSGVPVAAVDPRAPLASHALDSLHAIELAHALETRLGVPVEMESFFEAASIAELVGDLYTERAALAVAAAISAAAAAAEDAPAGPAPEGAAASLPAARSLAAGPLAAGLLAAGPPPAGPLAAGLLAAGPPPAGPPAAAPPAASQPAAGGFVSAPLSRGQRALWFLHQLDPEGAAYNVPAAVTIEGEVDVAALRRACRALLDRHAVLRGTFAAPHGEPVAHLHDASRVELSFAEVNAARWSGEELGERLLAEARRPFDLEHGPLLRICLFTRSKQEHVLLLSIHHIATDFWSQALLLAELDSLYPAACAAAALDGAELDAARLDAAQIDGAQSDGAGAAPLAAAPSYADATRWQEEMLAGEQGRRLREHWLRRLAGELPQLELPTDRGRPPVQSAAGATVAVMVPPAVAGQLKAIAQRGGATLFMTLLAAFDTLLYRYSSQRDLLVGVPNAGRGRAGLAGTVGYFVNPLIMRADLTGNPPFAALLAQVRRGALAAFEHADYPFPTLVEELQPHRDPSRTPLFQAMFVLQRAPQLKGHDLTPFALGEPGARLVVGGLPLVSYPLPERIAQFDLTLSMGEVGGGLKAAFNYNTDLFDTVTIERMADHFRALLAAISGVSGVSGTAGADGGPECRVADLQLLSEAERRRLLHGWNHTRAHFPAAARIHDLFADQARHTPGNPAVICEDTEITYAELAGRAERLGRHLAALGIGPETLVGICAERSVELVTGILGVLAAGAAYLPLDPEYPRERLAFMLHDAGARLLLTQESLLPLLPDAAPDLPVLCLDSGWREIEAGVAGVGGAAAAAVTAVAAVAAVAGGVPRPADPQSVACVIYTSGSTGQPKGVALTHRNLVNLAVSFIRSYSPDGEDRILPLTSIASASFVGEIFPLLCSAGGLVLPTREQTLDTAKLLELIARRGVSILSTVPSLIATLNTLKDELPKLRLILSGGEALAAADVDRILESAAIVNGYGLTETTICSTYYPVSLADLQSRGTLPIGRPLMNHQVYILDYELGLTPIGCHGKLYIGGEGLARGYWRNPCLTAERFLPNPYQPGERMYLTGDLARWLPDGNIEFLGRVDHQVKVRGYRIELGEIEAALCRHPAVAEARVVPRLDQAGERGERGERGAVSLAAYYVVDPGQAAPGASELLALLRETLPEYMVPAALMALPALPLTPNGKLDVRALPAPAALRPELAAPYAAPESELERIIATVWRQALRVDKVGIHDNFFDLGGHSLLLAQVHARLREALGRELSLIDLFKNPTVHALAAALASSSRAAAAGIGAAADGKPAAAAGPMPGGTSGVPGGPEVSAPSGPGGAAAAGLHALPGAPATGTAGTAGTAASPTAIARGAAGASGAAGDGGVPGTGKEIAIIGMSGRFPGASGVDELWRNLREGVETIRFFDDQELLAAGIDPELIARPDYVKAKGVVGDVEWFDAGLFGINPREAELMDPQHRIFLECAWEALERAGYNSGAPSGRVGVFGGVSMNTYLITNILPDLELVASADTLQASLGNDKDPLTSRVSYKLNLKGPSITVQSASSTGLVTIHVACQSLLNDDCDMALAGGVSLHLPEVAGYLYQEGGTTSPDGHCRAFDARARGFVAGGGCGVVVLKRLRHALADGDHVHAVIRGSACNNDGSLKVSYTAPSVDGQVEVYTRAYENAGVTPDTLTYVECHGTATPMGDPIEVAALTQAFRGYTDRKGFCAIGSLKTNIGHLDAAAGACGLIKAALALEHREIPPSLHFERPNPHIDFANSPFFVNAALRPWETGGLPRRAGVTSLGMGGTNAHVILEEAPLAPAAGPSRSWQLLLLSANTATALERATANLAGFLEERPLLDVADVAFTLQVGRRRFGHRRALLCQGREDAVAALGRLDPERLLTVQQEPGNRPVVFLFTGQGSQYPNMGRGLYESEPTFRHAIDQCAELLRISLGGADLRDLLYPSETAAGLEGPAARLRQTAIAQPALFAVEYALAQLWMEWGVRPQAMLGHSVGEYVAACLAGVFSLRDALELVAARGRLMQQLPGGAMLAVPLAEAEVAGELGDQLSVAAINRPDLTVVAGPAPAVAELERRLAARGLTCRALHTSHAFHSAMMDPILPHFAERVRRVRLSPPRLPYVSNLTGTWIRPEEATDPLYWAEHIRRPVRFAAGLAELLAEPSRLLLEVGPGNSLTTLARQHPARRASQPALPSLRHPRERGDDVGFLLGTVAQLWLAGVEIDWRGFYAYERRRRVPAPTYPFERRRYWVEPSRAAGAAGRPAAERAARARRREPADWCYAPTWRRLAPAARVASAAGPDPGAAALHGGPVLIFADGAGLGDELARRLAAAGRDVFTATPGAHFGRTGERSYALDPAGADGYDLLLEELSRHGVTPASVLHLWTVGPIGDAASAPGAAALDAAMDLGFHSLVRLAQALGKRSLTEPATLLVVSSGVQRVTGDETLQPAKAVLLGPCRVIPREYPNLACRSLDLPAPPPGPETMPAGVAHQADDAAAAGEAVPEQRSRQRRQRWLDSAAAGVLEELARLRAAAESRRATPAAATAAAGANAGGHAAEAEVEAVALRGGYRWVEGFDQLPLPALPAGLEPACLRQRGVYLVTGGLGGLGLEVAAYLAQAVAARLVLVGATPLPDRADWDEWLQAHDATNRVSRRILRVRDLEAAGAEVLVAAADVADMAAMEAVRDEALARFGAIHGAIHAAGRPGGGILQLKTAAAAAAVLDPKVRGARVLDEVLAGQQLDFLLLFSSNTAVLAQPGQADYVAANAFLDAFAEERRARGAATLAIGWDAWREVGMAVDTEVPAELRAWRREELEQGLSSVEGVELLRRALAAMDGTARLLVSTMDLEDRLARGRRAAAALTGGGLAGEAGADGVASVEPLSGRTSHPRPPLANPYVPPRDDGERRIAAVWQELLGIDPVGVHDNFFDLGGNSLMAIRVISRLKSDLGADVSEVSIFEGPTVASLAKLISPEPEQEPALQDSRSRGERRLARRGRGRLSDADLYLPCGL